MAPLGKLMSLPANSVFFHRTTLTPPSQIPLLVGIVLVMTYLRPNTLLKDWTLSGSAQTIRAGTEQMIGEMQRRVTRTFTGAAATNDAGVAPPVAAV